MSTGSFNQKFVEMFGFELSFVDCTQCGKPTTSSPCFDCERRAAREADERREHQQRLEVLRKKCNLPEDYAWANLGSPLLAQRVKTRAPAADVATAVKAFPGPFVHFRGDSRTGKTSLAIAIARSVEGGTFYSAHQVSTARSEHPLGKGEPPIIRWARDCPLLVLDELGTVLPHLKENVLDVLWKREQAGRKTIITTGLTAFELADIFGSGLLGRLKERGRALEVLFGGAT